MFRVGTTVRGSALVLVYGRTIIFSTLTNDAQQACVGPFEFASWIIDFPFNGVYSFSLIFPPYMSYAAIDGLKIPLRPTLSRCGRPSTLRVHGLFHSFRAPLAWNIFPRTP